MSKLRINKQTKPGQEVVLVSIDSAKNENQAYCVLSNGQAEIPSFKFSNEHSGFVEFGAQIRAFASQHGKSQVWLGIESTSTYGKPLIHFACQQGWEVRWVNPVHTYRMKEIHDNTPDKNDAKDTYIISELMSMGKLLQYNKRDTLSEELRSLHRHRHQLTKQLTQLCNRAESLAAEAFPELPKLVKRGLRSKTIWHILEHCPLPADILSKEESWLAERLKKASCGQFKGKRVKELINKAQYSTGYCPNPIATRQRFKGMAQQFHLLCRQVEECETQMEKLLKQDAFFAKWLEIKGLGAIILGGLIGEIGDIHAFDNVESLIKYAGFNLYSYQSGKYKGQHKVSKRGSRQLRRVCYLAAVSLSSNGRMLVMAGALPRCLKKPGMVAMANLAKKFLRCVYGAWKNGQVLNPGLVAKTPKSEENKQ
ncbi:MAG: IS110 family transposase [Lewinellaceae bacterium]|nr:IS110 family transposase [Lewinellaceae bacterium]